MYVVPLLYCTPEHKPNQTQSTVCTVQRDRPDQTEPHTHVSDVMGASFRKSPAHDPLSARARKTRLLHGAKEGEEQEHRQDGTTEGGSRAVQRGAERSRAARHSLLREPARSLSPPARRTLQSTANHPDSKPHPSCRSTYRSHTYMSYRIPPSHRARKTSQPASTTDRRGSHSQQKQNTTSK